MCVSLINGKYFMVILFLKTPLSDFCSILQLINSQAGTVHAYMAHLCWSGRRVTALDQQVWGRKKKPSELIPTEPAASMVAHGIQSRAYPCQQFTAKGS